MIQIDQVIMSFYATKGEAGARRKRKATKRSKRRVVESDSSWSSNSESESEDSFYESDISEPSPKKSKPSSSANAGEESTVHAVTVRPRSGGDKGLEEEGSDMKKQMDEETLAELPQELSKIEQRLRKKYKPKKNWLLVSVPICRSFGFYHNKFYRYDRKMFLKGILKGVIPSVLGKLEPKLKSDGHRNGIDTLLNRCSAQVMKILQVLPIPPRQRRLKHYLPPYQSLPTLMEEAMEANKISNEQEALLQEKMDICKQNRALTHRQLAQLREKIKALEAERTSLVGLRKSFYDNLPDDRGAMPHYVLPKRVQSSARSTQACASSIQVKDFEPKEFKALELLDKYLA